MIAVDIRSPEDARRWESRRRMGSGESLTISPVIYCSCDLVNGEENGRQVVLYMEY